MAHEQNLTSISVQAGSDISANQYRFHTINSSGQLARTGDGAKTDGVVQDNNASAQGRVAQLAVAGVTKVVAGAAVTAGDDVASDSAGRGVTAASGDVVAGRALEDASGAGVIFSVLLNPQREPLS